MIKVLCVNAEDFDCRVQANVTRKQLNEYLREDGVFFPIAVSYTQLTLPTNREV